MKYIARIRWLLLLSVERCWCCCRLDVHVGDSFLTRRGARQSRTQTGRRSIEVHRWTGYRILRLWYMHYTQLHDLSTVPVPVYVLYIMTNETTLESFKRRSGCSGYVVFVWPLSFCVARVAWHRMLIFDSLICLSFRIFWTALYSIYTSN